jgi:hypothetical protein
VLAYVFWHRPGKAVDTAIYEDAQRDFHEAIEVDSACFRIERLPFAEASGYEDWYLADDWAQIGALSEAAVDARRGASHDRAASLAGEGWGAIYSLVRGEARIPCGVEWVDKPRGEPSTEFVASLPHEGVWRRQLVLGPAPEFCCSASKSNARTPI